MLEIDGSYHEGGGQIVRTSVALSALSGTSVRITNIRAKRCNPGLSAQHLTGVQALAEISGARVSGASVGSTALEFVPGKIKGGKYFFDVGTAGSIPLVLQTLVMPSIFADKEILFEIKGGTHVRWSPTMDYFSEVFCYFLKKLGVGILVEVKKYGFYPKGGGVVSVSIKPAKRLLRADFAERGTSKGVSAISIATEGLRGAKVAERQLAGFEKSFGEKCKPKLSYVSSLSPGTSFFASALFENGMLGASALGEIGKPAEKVGEEAAHLLRKQMASGACLDEWMADQILPFLALSGGNVSAAEITPHVRTNIWVVERFFGKIFDVEEKSHTIAVKEPVKIRVSSLMPLA